MRNIIFILISCFAASSSAAAVIEFDEFADGTSISNQYDDFVVDLVGTDIEASIFFGTDSGGGTTTRLINNGSITNVGYYMLITFESLAEDVVIEYSSINAEGGAEITTESGTSFQAMQSSGCRISLCTADFSSYGVISSLLFIFETEQFIDLWSIERMSYTVSDGDSPSPVPLPAGLPLLVAGLGGLMVVGKRKNRNIQI